MNQYIQKDCLNCNKNFNAEKSEVNRGNAKFCSLACSSSYAGKQRRKKRKLNVECAYCNKKFYKRPSALSKSKSGLFFCCRAHKDIGQSTIKEIQPAHYGTANGRNDYRKRALDYYPNHCSLCNYNTIAVLIVHHKDCNRENNDLENLQILCRNCHYLEHLAN
tara:strand:- start:224 stop:712 length:489 start_codon:yes stop_codon:yes gene_type:complete